MSEQDRNEQIRKSLADARLVEIELDEFPDRIREVKQVAVGHLGELLQQDAALREHRSVAQSLGTLSRLEATLRADADRQKPEQSNLPAKPKQR
ncbi:MAG TPA: hypothetical protein VLL05_17280 [Terriglobales bacterium]|nr:hypothetical protein [Terriglobales bacterium]